jgi:hypothetical protein
MTLLADPTVDWSAVLEVIWSSLLGGIGVTAAFALGILGASRAFVYRREGNVAVAGAYALLMTLAFAAVGAAVVFGIVVMTSK